MLFTAPDGWGYFWAGGIICSTIGKITCEKCSKSRMGEEIKKKLTPTIRCCEQHLMVKHIVCSTIGKIICEKSPKSRIWEQVKKNPNHQILWTAADSWGIICSTIGKITREKCPKSRMGEEVKKN